MQSTSKRTVDPSSLEFQAAFSSEDLALAFEEQDDPDEDLFFQIFSGQWNDLTLSQQLLALSKVASLVETANLAAGLNLAASPPQPKG